MGDTFTATFQYKNLQYPHQVWDQAIEAQRSLLGNLYKVPDARLKFEGDLVEVTFFNRRDFEIFTQFNKKVWVEGGEGYFTKKPVPVVTEKKGFFARWFGGSN